MTSEYFRSIIPASRFDPGRLQNRLAGACWHFLGAVKIRTDQPLTSLFPIVRHGALFLGEAKAVALEQMDEKQRAHEAAIQ